MQITEEIQKGISATVGMVLGIYRHSFTCIYDFEILSKKCIKCKVICSSRKTY